MNATRDRSDVDSVALVPAAELDQTTNWRIAQRLRTRCRRCRSSSLWRWRTAGDRRGPVTRWANRDRRLRVGSLNSACSSVSYHFRVRNGPAALRLPLSSGKRPRSRSVPPKVNRLRPATSGPSAGSRNCAGPDTAAASRRFFLFRYGSLSITAILATVVGRRIHRPRSGASAAGDLRHSNLT